MGVTTSKEGGGSSVVLRDVDAESIASTSGMSKSEVSQLLFVVPVVVVVVVVVVVIIVIVVAVVVVVVIVVVVVVFDIFVVVFLPISCSRFTMHMKVFQKAMRMGG